jgi:hypothetical protein
MRMRGWRAMSSDGIEGIERKCDLSQVPCCNELIEVVFAAAADQQRMAVQQQSLDGKN